MLRFRFLLRKVELNQEVILIGTVQKIPIKFICIYRSVNVLHQKYDGEKNSNFNLNYLRQRIYFSKCTVKQIF